MDPLVNNQAYDNNALFQPRLNFTNYFIILTPEITAIFVDRCSSFAICSAASISKVPYP